MDTRNNNQDQNQNQNPDAETQRTMGWERGEREDNADKNETDQPYIGADKDVSGNDILDEGRDQRSHHQQFGNRKYQSNTNHSSADDQPTTNTGPGNF